MNADVLKTIGSVLGLLIAAPLLLVVIRAFIYLGGAIKVQEQLSTTLERVSSRLDDHGVRILRIETERETEQRLAEERRHFRRRAADRGEDTGEHST